MKKWRFFPILVKEEIVKHMCLPDLVSFAKCSKKCQDLLNIVPIHRPSVLIDDHLHLQAFLGPRINLGLNLVSLDHFSILATSRKFFVDKFKICVTTEKYKQDLKDLIEKLTKARKSLKVKKLSMDFEVEHAELFTGILGICDPSRIESIQIPKLFSQEVYDEIVKTPQWRNSKGVSLNYMCHQDLKLPNAKIDDFLHFESVQLSIERLDTNDAIKLVQNLRNASDHGKFNIRCQEPMQHDLIRQKIEAGWAGNFQENQHTNTRFVIDPAKPGHVFEFNCSPYSLNGGWSLLEKFNRRQELFGRALARN
ncbi:unnamed protein product [Caenorhabditis brenneri]